MGRVLAALALPCIVVLVGFAAWAWKSHDSLVAAATREIAIERSLLPRFTRWQSKPRRPDGVRVVFFGDSLLLGGHKVVGGGAAKPFNLAKTYSRDLRGRGILASSFSLVHVAFRPIHLYYLLDEVLAAEPDLVVVGLNLRLFSPAVGRPGPAGFPNLSRKLSLAEQFEIREILAEDGVGWLDPAIHRLQEQTGTLYWPEGVRALGQEGLASSGRAVGRMLGLRVRSSGPIFDRERALAVYDVEPSLHPQALVSHEILERLRAEGVSVLFYVSPINPGPLSRLGVLEELELAESVEALRLGIGATRSEWLDLHDRLPEADFRDYLNHLNASGLAFVAQQTADASAPLLRARAARSGSRGTAP